ncbi:MAG: type II toxin-antitoxin system Phd/YefM family antitoxin [Nanoarchaeota archaeon]|nr:type II toxin-antitoxin system Phd/YefM family antitoxin [Actinomycetota bacterium]MBL7101122.1 type II toxin-antitoxin system Phd/YefM family antitoxin [Nanoarchaeota archaeon]MDP3011099.1 type II toxin-antitoxin system prevent-host-death family antitoxin [Candidatus Hydromicrobium sp.]
MKFISVRDFRIRPGDIWKQLKVDKDIIITSNGKPIAILYPVEQDNLESSLITLRRARALLAMEDIQKEAVNKGLDKTTEEEIEKEIKAMRLERSR